MVLGTIGSLPAMYLMNLGHVDKYLQITGLKLKFSYENKIEMERAALRDNVCVSF